MGCSKFYILLVWVLTTSLAAADTLPEGITYQSGTQNGNITYHVLEVDPARFDIVPARAREGTRETVVTLASRQGAFAAVNGGFFHNKGPIANHPRGLLKINNEWHASVNRTFSTIGWSNDHSKVIFDRIKATTTFESRDVKPMSTPPYTEASDWQAATQIISGKPLLVKAHEPIEDFSDENLDPDFIHERHPRTALGVKENGRWLFVTVDGKRLDRGTSPGMTLKELSELMKELGCKEAINLDGGGCTTMVIQGKIVNNHVGYEEDSDFNVIGHERKVPNAILIIPKSSPSDKELDADWKLDEFFGTIAVINLPQAVKRRESVDKELKSIGTKNHLFFRAIDGRKELDESFWGKFHGNRDKFDLTTEEGKLQLENLHKGEAGCYMSHYTLIKRIKESFDKAQADLAAAKQSNDANALNKAKEDVRKYSSVLILEDDCGFGFVDKTRTFVTRKGVGVHLRKALREVPKDWDMLYLVAQATEPTTIISERIRKIGTSWSTSAYAVSYRMYENLLHHLKKIEDPAVHEVQPFDTACSQIHHDYKVYAIYPSVVYNQAGKSTISDLSKARFWQGQPIPKIK